MAALSACDGFFGKKTDLSFIDIPDQSASRVAYVPVLPEIKGLTRPIQVATGFDNLIYVVDSAQAIVAFDEAGNQVGRFTGVPNVTYVTQDRRLDLLAIGRYDTIIGGQTYSLSSIYRIDMKKNGENNNTVLDLNTAQITRQIRHPFYYNKTSPTNPTYLNGVSLNGIAVLYDNRYYVTRTGSDNNPQKIGGPDDAVLLFDKYDNFVSPISMQGLGGSSVTNFFTSPFDITTLAKPPQSYNLPSGTKEDFIVTSLDTSRTLQVQYIEVSATENGTDYAVKYFDYGDTTKANGFLYTPQRFSKPYGVTYSGDSKNYIFVIDRDSLYQFTNTGYEGVPFGTYTKLQKVSFGGTGNSVLQFRRAKSVAYFNKTLYVADAGNGRLLRFKLSDDYR